jgi:hypothetical protein
MEVFMTGHLKKFVRKLRVLMYRFKKETIVVTNNTNTKLFLERRDGDFLKKKAVKIPPGETMTLVVSFCRGNILFLRNVERRLLEISEPVFQVEVVSGEKPGTYRFNSFE